VELVEGVSALRGQKRRGAQVGTRLLQGDCLEKKTGRKENTPPKLRVMTGCVPSKKKRTFTEREKQLDPATWGGTTRVEEKPNPFGGAEKTPNLFYFLLPLGVKATIEKKIKRPQ